MHVREQKGTTCTNTGEHNANVTIDLNGKTTYCDGMLPASLNRTTSHLSPHLGGIAASIGTYSRVGAYTLARAGASAL